MTLLLSEAQHSEPQPCRSKLVQDPRPRATKWRERCSCTRILGLGIRVVHRNARLRQLQIASRQAGCQWNVFNTGRWHALWPVYPYFVYMVSGLPTRLECWKRCPTSLPICPWVHMSGCCSLHCKQWDKKHQMPSSYWRVHLSVSPLLKPSAFYDVAFNWMCQLVVQKARSGKVSSNFSSESLLPQQATLGKNVFLMKAKPTKVW